jgi:hypothetical protein
MFLFPFSECLENVFHMLVHEEQQGILNKKAAPNTYTLEMALCM